MIFDSTAIRRQFPFLQNDPVPVYLDTAATAQKPHAVIDAMKDAMEKPVGNVHRGQHRETELASDAYEAARSAVAHFIGAAHADEIIFTKNCTEAINLAARSWGAVNLQSGDHIAVTILEHHSNIVPWLQLQKEKDIVIDWINLEQLESYVLDERVKLLCITGQSNVLGVRPDLKQWIDAAHAIGAKVLVDAAQLVAHAPIDVTETGCDFLAFSGHKIYGPTGIGVLYASRETMKQMQPFMGGGGMVHSVTTDGFSPADPPACFEAGTPPIIEAIGLNAAIKWQQQFTWADREQHDQDLMKTAMESLSNIEALRTLNSPFSILNSESSGCISFTINGVHPHDLTDLLGQKGFALRAGHQCAEPLHKRLGISASVRMSFGLYTTEEEIRSCVDAIKDIQKKFS
jgi:cysteine desulfurase / selenocysteine lyase